VPAQQTAPASGIVAAGLRPVEPATFKDDIVSLSKLGLQARGANGASTSDSALNLMSTFAERLFGGGVNVSSVSYNLQSFRGAAASSSSTGTADGTVSNTVFSLNESISFTGVGQLVTEDGSTFDFELSVKYQASVEASETIVRDPPSPIQTPDVLLLTGKPLPAIEFPGSLDDLFKLLSRELRTNISSGSSLEDQGALTLRLLRLVDRAALLAPRARADDPELPLAERAKLVANTYSNTAAGDARQA
jgi:hypothetical protein